VNRATTQKLGRCGAFHSGNLAKWLSRDETAVCTATLAASTASRASAKALDCSSADLSKVQAKRWPLRGRSPASLELVEQPAVAGECRSENRRNWPESRGACRLWHRFRMADAALATSLAKPASSS